MSYNIKYIRTLDITDSKIQDLFGIKKDDIEISSEIFDSDNEEYLYIFKMNGEYYREIIDKIEYIDGSIENKYIYAIKFSDFEKRKKDGNLEPEINIFIGSGEECIVCGKNYSEENKKTGILTCLMCGNKIKL